MAPVRIDQVDSEIKNVIQLLFETQSATHGYLGDETQRELVRKISSITQALRTLSISTTSSSPPSSPQPSTSHLHDPNPPLSSLYLTTEIVEYVSAARNPDIYTREFVELVQRGNQILKGKREAFAAFRDVLAEEIRTSLPECRGEVGRVLESFGVAGGDGDRAK